RGAEMASSNNLRSLALEYMCNTRCGSLNGRPRKNKSLIKLKIAVFRPMPSASVRTATKVNPGDLRSWRSAKLRSFISFGAERDHRIDVAGTTGGDETGDQ